MAVPESADLTSPSPFSDINLASYSSRFSELPFPGVVVVICDEDCQWFILEDRQEDENIPGIGGTLSFIGGGIEPLDISPEAALRRELAEELGDSHLVELIMCRAELKAVFQAEGVQYPSEWTCFTYVARFEQQAFGVLVTALKARSATPEGELCLLDRVTIETLARDPRLFHGGMHAIVNEGLLKFD